MWGRRRRHFGDSVLTGRHTPQKWTRSDKAQASSVPQRRTSGVGATISVTAVRRFAQLRPCAWVTAARGKMQGKLQLMWKTLSGCH